MCSSGTRVADTEPVTVGARGQEGASARNADDSARMRSLMDLVTVMTAARDYDDILHSMAEESRRALAASVVSLSVWERERGRIRTLVNVGDLAAGIEPHPDEEFYGLADHPLAIRMFTEGAGYLEHRGDDASDPAVQRILEREGQDSCVGVPIHLDGRVWGELYAARDARLPRFTERDLDFARLVATQVGAGIAQAEHLARVERLVYTDELTGLANRRAFEDHLDIAFAQHRDTGDDVSVVVADVNGLKQINDSEGHQEGNNALTAFASELSAAASQVPGVLVARVGGDEFCMLAGGIPFSRVLTLAEDVCLRASTVLEQGIAMGVATTEGLPRGAMSASRLLRAADAAQYRAKRSESRTPVVAGHRSTVDVDSPTPDTVDRRAFRGRGVHEPARLLDDVLRRLDEIPDHPPAMRAAAVAAELADNVDAAGWFVSKVDPVAGTIETAAEAVARAHSDRDSSRFYAVDEFPVEQYPASYAAATGLAVVVHVDDPRSDPAEAALLETGALLEMVMSGGRDLRGTQWLVEVVGDELSAPLRPYANVLRAALAVALRR